MTTVKQVTTALPALPVVHLPVREATGRNVLTGTPKGEADRPIVAQHVRSRSRGEDALVVVDFHGIDALSPSYLNAALWPLWLPQPSSEELFPVLVNVCPDFLDDIRLLMADKRTAAWWTPKTLTSSGEQLRTIGPLDQNLDITLRLIIESGAVTAADLLRFNTSIGVTAWSNRLASLHQQRLLRRQKDGRRLIYSSSWVGCVHE